MTSSVESFKESFFKLAEKGNRIVITSHMSPDDDSVGSVLSVYTVLVAKYPQKDIRILYTGERVSRYSVFHNFEKIEWVDDVAHHLEGVDMLVMLDASQYARFSKKPDVLKTVPVTVGIDHHASTPEEFTLLLYKPEYSSNCELVYRALVVEGEPFSKEQAEYVLLGILGDTGNFSYVKPSQSEVFVLAKSLVEKIGISVDQFRARYGGIPLRIIPLLQTLVANTTFETVEDWPPLQYTLLDRSVLEGGGYSDEDMSAASHIYLGQYLPRIEGYGWGFVITPRTDGTCRMSGRSLAGSVNVRDLHERLGIGSGHDRASGGFFVESDSKKCAATVLEWMKVNQPLLG